VVMTGFPTVRVAAVQATPVILDAEATVEKAARLLGEAAADGVRLAVLPETFVSLYPSNIWARRASGFGGFDQLWERLWASSIDVPGPEVDRLVEACREHNVHCAVGVNERESERPGTLYNTSS
jgi:nitrilase